jgi:hypothetical protein
MCKAHQVRAPSLPHDDTYALMGAGLTTSVCERLGECRVLRIHLRHDKSWISRGRSVANFCVVRRPRFVPGNQGQIWPTTWML